VLHAANIGATMETPMQTEHQRMSIGRIAGYSVLCAWSVFCGFPIYWLALASIKPVEVLAAPPTYVPFMDFSPTLDAWRFILADPAENLVFNFANSLLIGIVAALVSLLAAGLAIYGMTRFPAPRQWCRLVGHGPLMAMMLSVRVVPPVVLALPIYVIAAATGFLDTRTLLVGVYAAINLPVALWLLAPVFGRSATEQEEAALLDGASHAGIFFSVLLPMLLRPMGVTLLFLFVLCWNEYLFASYLTYDHAATLSPWMGSQLSMKEAQAGGEAEELSHMAAAAVFMAVPALILSVALHRALARSVAAMRH